MKGNQCTGTKINAPAEKTAEIKTKQGHEEKIKRRG